jgi:Tfp pilus assembly protein PilX
MGTTQLRSRGFTLIAALLLLLLLSGIAVGLMYMVNTETRVGGSDLENSLAFHSAEGGMEKMTADLANLFSSQQAPTPANIAASKSSTVIPGVSTGTTRSMFNRSLMEVSTVKREQFLQVRTPDSWLKLCR